MKAVPTLPRAEFSRLFAVEPQMGAGEDAETFAVEASPEERAALARRFGLVSLDALAARGRVEVFARGRRARLSATFVADVVQSCVVTLAPVPAHLEAAFTIDYDRDAALQGAEVTVEPEGDGPPDLLPAEGIDLGEAVAEQLGLALEPYPRAPGAALGPEAETGPESPRESPFSVLKQLKER